MNKAINMKASIFSICQDPLKVFLKFFTIVQMLAA